MCINSNKTSIVILLATVSLVFFNGKSVTEILEVNKCPLCYGLSCCTEFSTGRLALWNSDIVLKTVLSIQYTFRFAFVLFASRDNEDVVIKPFKLEEFDSSKYETNTTLFDGDSILDSIKQLLLVPFNSTLLPKIRLCPTTNNLEILLGSIHPSENAFDHFQNLWFTLKNNPEPFVQQILRAEDGWPVPKYFGSCGRVIVSEYCGKMLTDSVGVEWKFRKRIAHQLLESAFNFTFNHPHFAFYLTDVTPDNIAVTPSGDVKFIDLDNIIIVEKNTAAKLPSWTEIHSSEDIECNNCLAFSSDDICSHQHSDHNIYAVCREILNTESHLIEGGLLHSAPQAFLKKNPDFETILSQCVRPMPAEYDRFYYAKQLMKILE